MTTPAQNIEYTLSSVGTRRESYVYSNGTVVPGSLYTVASRSACQREIRPQSGSSPVRADGSRAPRAWDRRWGVLVCPVRDHVYFVDVGSNPYRRIDARDSLLVWAANGLDVALAAGGAHWSRRSDAGSFPSGVESSARSKFRKELQDGKADWGVTLGEMRQTVKGVRQLSEETLDVISYLARTARRTKREIVREIMGIPPRSRSARPWLPNKDRKIINTWLEYQFSVKPLLGDIQTSSEALSHLLFEENRPMRLKIKTGASSTSEARYTSSSPYNPGWTGTVRLQTTTQCHISAVYDVVPTTERTFQQLGLTNPAVVAWELTTLSWMVDYLWGVGDWLQSLTRIDGASFVEGSLTRVQRCKYAGPVSFTPSSSSVKLVGGFNDYEVSISAGRMQRVVLPPEGVTPGLHPAFRNRMGLTQMANSLAVLSQLLR